MRAETSLSKDYLLSNINLKESQTSFISIYFLENFSFIQWKVFFYILGKPSFRKSQKIKGRGGVGWKGSLVVHYSNLNHLHRLTGKFTVNFSLRMSLSVDCKTDGDKLFLLQR